MPGAGRQMAQRAGAHRRLDAVGDDRRHRRVIARKPVRRIEPVVDLRLGVLLVAARHLLERDAVERLRLGRDRIGPVEPFRGNRERRQRRKQHNADEPFHDVLPERGPVVAGTDRKRIRCGRVATRDRHAAVSPPSRTSVCPVTDAACRARQPAHRRRHLLGGRQPMQRDALEHRRHVGRVRSLLGARGRVGLHAAGRHRVDADAVLAPLDRQHLGHVDDRRLGDAVGRALGRADQAVRRHDVDDAARLAAPRSSGVRPAATGRTCRACSSSSPRPIRPA